MWGAAPSAANGWRVSQQYSATGDTGAQQLGLQSTRRRQVIPHPADKANAFFLDAFRSQLLVQDHRIDVAPRVAAAAGILPLAVELAGKP
ncbi:hypothetical protein ACFFX0_13680 [Citricoccus parietis]|uniref:Uncharacterized protein n=1 Tax=Citricoccus parietis TaxID=592307 RepID=A0ABV5FZV2_9MICC